MGGSPADKEMIASLQKENEDLKSKVNRNSSTTEKLGVGKLVIGIIIGSCGILIS